MTALREKLARAIDPDAFELDGFQRPLVRDSAGRKEDAFRSATAVLATIEESSMVIVPREATEEMVEAGARQIVMVGDDWAQTKSSWDEMPDYGRDHWRDQARCSFPAMLAAAPKESTS